MTCEEQHQEAEEIDDRVETRNQHLRAEVHALVVRQGTTADLAAHDRAEQVVARVLATALDERREIVVQRLQCGRNTHRPIGSRGLVREVLESRCVRRRQVEQREKDAYRQCPRVGRRKIAGAGRPDGLDQLDRDLAHRLFERTHAPRRESGVQDIAIRAVLGRIERRGQELVLLTARFRHQDDVAREGREIVEHFGHRLAAQRHPVPAVVRRPDDVGRRSASCRAFQAA